MPLVRKLASSAVGGTVPNEFLLDWLLPFTWTADNTTNISRTSILPPSLQFLVSLTEVYRA